MEKSCRLLIMVTCLFVVFVLGGQSWAQTQGNRFEKVDNDTVLDHGTGLMWAATDNGEDITWEQAKFYCETYTGGGHNDWRLPTLAELDTLFDQNSTKRFKAFLPIDLSGCCPWTSDTRLSRARTIFFMTGEINTLDKITSSSMRALPVRTAR